MNFLISQKEFDELVKTNFPAETKIEKGEIIISAMKGMVKFAVKEPETPAPLHGVVSFDIQMSMTVRMFLGKIRQELEKRGLSEAIRITPEYLSVEINRLKKTALLNWLVTKTLKELNFRDDGISIFIE
jgi:hypothetical protein